MSTNAIEAEPGKWNLRKQFHKRYYIIINVRLNKRLQIKIKTT